MNLFPEAFDLSIDPSMPFAADMRPEGWTLLKDYTGPNTCQVEAEHVDIPRHSLGITDSEFLELADQNISLGQRHAEALMSDPRMPAAPSQGLVILAFAATQWKNPDGLVAIPVLMGIGGEWKFYFRGLIRGFTSDHWFLVHAAKSTSVKL